MNFDTYEKHVFVLEYKSASKCISAAGSQGISSTNLGNVSSNQPA
jgi:hypothetical protein